MGDNLVDVIYLLVFVVQVLAVARATRIFNIDEVATPLRSWVYRNAEKKPNSRPWRLLEALVKCFWCSAVWISGLMCAFTLSMLALLGHATWAEAGAAWPMTTLAIAYAASWVLDQEEN